MHLNSFGKRRFLAALLVALLGIAACGQEPDDDPSVAAAPPCDPAMAGGLAAWAGLGFTGSVAFARSGTIECAAGYGDADRAAGTSIDAETVFSIGSISKVFTAAAALRLVDDGVLSLDDQAGRWLPQLSGSTAALTVEQLLTHSSGLQGTHGRDHEPLASDDAVVAIDGLDIVFEPGSESQYSNAGYTLLALLVEEAAGRPFRTFLAEEILRGGGFWDGQPGPDGPRAIGYLTDGSTGEPGDFAGPHWALDGNGGLAMTPTELLRWTEALLAGEVISQESVARMTAPSFDLGDGTAEGMGWIVLDESLLGVPALATSGGGGSIGHEMTVVAVPSQARIYVVASNGPDVSAESLMQSILPQLLADEPIAAPADPAAAATIDPAIVATIVGTYDLASGAAVIVTEADGRLEVAAEGPAAIAALLPPPDVVRPDEVADHERLVADFIDGGTEEGRQERELLEAEFGPVDEASIDATIFADFELRTYLTIRFDDGTEVPAWIALDDRGGLAGAEIFPPPPSLRLAPVGDDELAFVPLDLDGTGPDITITFADPTLTITGPAGSSTTGTRR